MSQQMTDPVSLSFALDWYRSGKSRSSRSHLWRRIARGGRTLTLRRALWRMASARWLASSEASKEWG